VLFVLAACVGILLLAHNPEGGEHLRDLLVEQILWANYTGLAIPAMIYAAILIAWFTLPRRDHPLLFYPLFAVMVTVSVQLVGVYLVFASLILPAIAARKRDGHGGLWLGYLLGTLGYATGLLLSLVFDLPAGALIVCALLAWVLPWMIAHRKQQPETMSANEEIDTGIELG